MAHGRRWRYGTGLSGVKGARSLLGAWLAACACGVMAQSAQPAPGVPMADLPPAVVSAPLPDVGSMASRVLACTACHGPEGRATPSGYFPRIAGKPAQVGWGSQIRSYVLQPYQMVKDIRTEVESGNVAAVLDGDLDSFMEGFLRWRRGQAE